jgi:hypothetical protein
MIAMLFINKFLWLCRILETQKQSALAQGLKVKELHSRVTPVRLPPRTQFLRRLDHGILLDVNHLDKTSINSVLLSNQSPTSEKWLGARKVVNARPYDTWKTPKAVGDDFSLPNVPGGNIMFCFLTFICLRQSYIPYGLGHRTSDVTPGPLTVTDTSIMFHLTNFDASRNVILHMGYGSTVGGGGVWGGGGR